MAFRTKAREPSRVLRVCSDPLGVGGRIRLRRGGPRSGGGARYPGRFTGHKPQERTLARNQRHAMHHFLRAPVQPDSASQEPVMEVDEGHMS